MKPIDAEGFEEMFRRNVDPWNYAHSPFEAFKRDRLLKACGLRLYDRGLELACANGETTRRLALRCLRLLAVDSSETALAEARRRTESLPNVAFERVHLPDQTPGGPFDLIVASEILYYLPQSAMLELLERIKRALAPGGRVVLLHHTLPFADAAQLPILAQAKAKANLGQKLDLVMQARHRRFDVAAFEKPVG